MKTMVGVPKSGQFTGTKGEGKMLLTKARVGVEANMLAETTMDSEDSGLWLLSADCVQTSEQHCLVSGTLKMGYY
jgi:hypothetical protein